MLDSSLSYLHQTNKKKNKSRSDTTAVHLFPEPLNLVHGTHLHSITLVIVATAGVSKRKTNTKKYAPRAGYHIGDGMEVEGAGRGRIKEFWTQ